MPPELRDYQLIKLTGWTFDELDNQPAARCDWLLQIERVFRNHERGE